ncbi:hypothetical protein [Streptomyces goshikiensis]
MRSRAFDRAVLWSLAVVMGGTAVWMLFAGQERSSLIATVGAYFLGALAVALPILERLLRPQRLPVLDPVAEADELARTVGAQWSAEARTRGLREPRVVPLTWSASARQVADEPDRVYPAAGPGRISRIALDGRLDHGFDDALLVLAEGYGRIPSGRLVVLGEPGTGKTVLAILLTLGLLGRRQDGTRTKVPVLLSASSWDPVRQTLQGRLVESLAATYYAGRPEIPQLLLDEGLLLPVLDGLDEIPESGRRTAVQAVNRYVGDDRPVVLTCRTTEYEDVVAGGAPVLLRAPVVEVHPVSVTDATAYLEGVDWPTGTDWGRVVTHLRDGARSPVHEALSTPLMLSLARMVYGRLGGDPSVLLDASQFDCRHAIEDHLSDQVVDAAYAPERLPSGEPDPDVPEPAWQPDEVRRWLTFLAHHLHRYGEREFAWWRMSRRVLPQWAVLGGSVAVGMAFTALVVMLATWSGNEDIPSVLVSSGVLGGVSTMGLVVLWFVFPERQPGRLSFTFAGSLGRLRRGFATGFLVAGLLGLSVLVTTSMVFWTGDRTVAYYIGFAELIAGTVAVAASVGLALAAHNWLDAPPPSAVRTTPESLLAQDRRSSVCGAALAGLVLVLTMPLLLLTGLTAGKLAGQAATGWAGQPGRFDPDAALASVLKGTPTVLGNPGLLLKVFLPLTSVAFMVTVLFSRAYPRFLVALAYLKMRGRLPWRLTHFLTDAHRRGLLRQSGPAYQFRHVRLQEHLVAAPDGPDGAEPGPGRTAPAARDVPAGARIRWVRTAGLAAGAVVLLAPFIVAPRDSSFLTLGPFLNEVSALDFSPDGRLLATVDGGSRLLTGGPAAGGQVWTVEGRRLSQLQGADRLLDLTFDASGRTVEGTLVGDESLEPLHQTWDPWTGKPSGASQVRRAADSGHALLEAVPIQDRVVVKDLTTQEDWVVLTGPQAQQVTDTLFSPDGRFLVTFRYTREAQLWSMEDGSPLGDPVEGLTATLKAHFSPDSSVMALKRLDVEELQVIATVDGRRVSTLPTESGFGDYTFSPDGRTLVSSSPYSDARLWDVTSGQQIGKPLTGTAVSRRESGSQAHFHVTYSRDGRTLATTAGSRAQQLRLWNVADASPVGPVLYGHTDPVNDIEFTPDGRTLASGSDDRTVRLWRVQGTGPGPAPR